MVGRAILGGLFCWVAERHVNDNKLHHYSSVFDLEVMDAYFKGNQSNNKLTSPVKVDKSGSFNQNLNDKEKKGKPESNSADQSIKSLLKTKKLPTQGNIRYVPPKDLKPVQGLPYEKIGNEKAFIDRFGNKWIKGPSRTPGKPFEWDVQLSKQGKE